jgi:hypothetical protein
MKMKRYESFDDYHADQEPKNRTMIGALRRFVKREAPRLEESVKWGNGCWLKNGSPVAYVYSAPDHVQFGFFAGAALKDPKGLLRGKGAYVRHIRLERSADLEPGPFRALLKQAVTKT